MHKVRLFVTFLDGADDEAVGTGIEIIDGMIIIDFGPTAGQAGFNVRALKSWYTEIEWV